MKEENDIEINKNYNDLKASIKRDLEKNELSIEEKEQGLCESLKSKWKKIKLISGFKKNSLISSCIIDYFKRPFSSHFLHSQNLKLYSFNSCIPLPKVLCKYPIKINIEFHLESIFTNYNGDDQCSFDKNALIRANKDKNEITLNDNNNDRTVYYHESLSHYTKDVSLINVYVI